MRRLVICILIFNIGFAGSVNSQIGKDKISGIWCTIYGDYRMEFAKDGACYIDNIGAVIRFGESRERDKNPYRWKLKNDTIVYYHPWYPNNEKSYRILKSSENALVLTIQRSALRQDTFELTRYPAKKEIISFEPLVKRFIGKDSLKIYRFYNKELIGEAEDIFLDGDDEYWLIHPKHKGKWFIVKFNNHEYLYFTNPVFKKISSSSIEFEIYLIENIKDNKIRLKQWPWVSYEYGGEITEIHAERRIMSTTKADFLTFETVKPIATNNWKTIDCHSFTVKTPWDYKYKPVRGIDSQPGIIKKGKLLFRFDFGCHSSSIPTEEEHLSNLLEHDHVREEFKNHIKKQYKEYEQLEMAGANIDSIIQNSTIRFEKAPDFLRVEYPQFHYCYKLLFVNSIVYVPSYKSPEIMRLREENMQFETSVGEGGFNRKIYFSEKSGFAGIHIWKDNSGPRLCKNLVFATNNFNKKNARTVIQILKTIELKY